MSIATDRQPIDAYAVALDETEFYNLDPADARYIERIDWVYLFDRNERTHLCEWTPSYYLIYLYTDIVFTPDADEEIRDALDQKYAHEASDNEYMHCHDIERIIAANKRDRISHYGDVAQHDLVNEIEDAGERRDAELEAIREDLCANCPF
jgi:hypothetical protein